MKRVVDVLYGLQGFPNATRFGEFKTDLFSYGTTPAIDIDDDVVTGLTVSGATTSAFVITGATSFGIDVTAVAGMANFIRFNTFAGCLSYADVDPADVPSGGGLGADGCIQIDIGGSDYFIPIFQTTLS